MNILVTGGAGFIGSHLCAYHIEKGDHVWAVDNLLTGATRNIKKYIGSDKFTFIEADITEINPESLPACDTVYHMASPASPIQYKKYPIETLMVNSLGTKHILDYVVRTRAVFVLASTSEVYGDPLEHPQKETYYGNVNSVGPRACYDEAKRFAEAITVSYIQKHDINARIARIFNTYGPHMEVQDGRVVSNFITQALRNEPITIYGDGTQTRSFCYVSDLVRGLTALATTPDLKGSVINLGNTEEMTVTEFAVLIQKLTNTKSKLEYRVIPDKNDPKRRRPDISKAKKLLKWEPEVPVVEGLKKTIEYFEHIL